MLLVCVVLCSVRVSFAVFRYDVLRYVVLCCVKVCCDVVCSVKLWCAVV